MKRKLQILLLCLCLPFISLADHVAGGQISYKHISTVGNNSTYEVEVVVYGDCAGSTYFSWATTTGARFYIYKEGTLHLVHILPRVNTESNILISEVCPTSINQTTCNAGNIVGIKKYTFRGNIVLNGTSADWRFVFTDELPGGEAPGRSTLADNITNPASMFYIEAKLNNVNGPNNSPTFQSNPVPFFCQGIPSSFEVSAIDVDGDSLVYSLVPVQSAANTFATYNTGYSASQPLNVVPGSFTFSAQTGVAEFIPNASSWEGIVVNKITEYRNGIIVGTIMREMLFVYLSNCQNQVPNTNVQHVLNGQLLNNNTSHNIAFSTCNAQSGVFSFDVIVSDPDLDNITISSHNLPAGANVNIQNNGSQNPIVNFSWAVSTVPSGTYHFYITYKDDGCPLASVKTIVYTINVLAFEGSFSTNSISPCRLDSNGIAYILPNANNASSYSYTWLDPSFNILKSATGLQSEGDTLLNIHAGTYIVQVNNDIGCMQQFSIQLDSPTYRAQFKTDSIICIQSFLNFNPVFTNNDFDTWDWTFGDGQSSTAQFPQIQYSNPGQYSIQLIGTTSTGCKDTFVQNVVVDSTSWAEFELSKDEICAGEQVTISAVYGQNLENVSWSFEDGGYLQSTDTVIKYGFPIPGIYEINMLAHFRACSDVNFSKSIIVNDYPKVDLGSDTSICYQGHPILLKNIEDNQVNDRFKWNTGASTDQIYAQHHGVYSLTVTRNDCSTSDSIDIKKDCYIDIPNAFIPSNSDASGYFFPRSILSKGVKQFDMTIYNRWGQIMFQTNNPEGRGWDGRFNGQMQEQGVYVYQIAVTYTNGVSEKYQGNVTLLK